MEGHKSRIWDVCSNRNGNIVASASGDGTVKLWELKMAATDDLNIEFADCIKTIGNHNGDVYSVHLHPGQTLFLPAQYALVINSKFFC